MAAMSRPYERISTLQLDRWRDELSERADSEPFRARVDEIHRAVGPTPFFVQGGLQFLRDAWIGARVATALVAEKVRLWPEERPDFELLLHGESRLFEATEADFPGRRRSDEYREVTSEIEDDPVEDWRKRFDAIPSAVRRVVSKKLLKGYPESVSLAVYVNLGCYGAYVQEGLPILQRETSIAKSAFREVFVYWKGVLYSFWKSGRPNFEKWPAVRTSDF